MSSPTQQASSASSASHTASSASSAGSARASIRKEDPFASSSIAPARSSLSLRERFQRSLSSTYAALTTSSKKSFVPGKPYHTDWGVVLIENPGPKSLFWAFSRQLIAQASELKIQGRWNFETVEAGDIPDLLSEIVVKWMQETLIRGKDEHLERFINFALQKSAPMYLQYLENTLRRTQESIHEKASELSEAIIDSIPSESLSSLKQKESLLKNTIAHIHACGLPPSIYFRGIMDGIIHAGFAELYALKQLYSPMNVYSYIVDARHHRKSDLMVLSDGPRRDSFEVWLELDSDSTFHSLISLHSDGESLRSTGGVFPMEMQSPPSERFKSSKKLHDGPKLLTEGGLALIQHPDGNCLFRSVAAGLQKLSESTEAQEIEIQISHESLRMKTAVWLKSAVEEGRDQTLMSYMMATIQDASPNYIQYLLLQQSKKVKELLGDLNMKTSQSETLRKLGETSIPYVEAAIQKIKANLDAITQNSGFMPVDMYLEALIEDGFYAGLAELYALSKIYNVTFFIFQVDEFHCITGDPLLINFEERSPKPVIHLEFIELAIGKGQNHYNTVLRM